MEAHIPNYDRYKTIIEWWIEGGLNKIGNDIKKSLYRLIKNCGKTYNELYLIFPKTLVIGTIIKLDLISTSPNKIKSKQNVIKIINARGISIEDFEKTKGNIYKNEIITFGEFKVTDENTLEFINKQNYSELIERVNKINSEEYSLNEYSSKINRITNEIIEKLNMRIK